MHDKKRIKREILVSINYLLERYPAVAIIGARQTGKTTLCQLARRNWKKIDLENEEDFNLVRRDPEFFLQQNPRHIIIDEAQDLPELFRALRVTIDQSRKENGRFLITGSSSPNLVSNFSESLAGRVALVELSTFKATEIAETKSSSLYAAIEDEVNISKIESLSSILSTEALKNAWYRGGYPDASLTDTKKDYVLWMENYRQTYIHRDIRKLFPGLQFETFRNFVSMLSRLSGTILNYSDLARSLNVSQPTVRQYVDIVHSTFVWRKIEPYTRNITKRISKMPRGHVRDSGLLHYLLNIGSYDRLVRDPIVGRSWESFVIEEILKGMQNNLVPCTPYYLRTAHGAEIDLILEGNFGLLPIEIKLGTTVDHRSLHALKDFVKTQQLKAGIVVNNSTKLEWLSDKILQLPATVI